MAAAAREVAAWRTAAARDQAKRRADSRVAKKRRAGKLVDGGLEVGLFFNYTKPIWQTIGETTKLHLPYVLATCQITRFGK